jgi:hypothetical protein
MPAMARRRESRSVAMKNARLVAIARSTRCGNVNPTRINTITAFVLQNRIYSS